MAFHDRLKQARKNARLTQDAVARILGIAKSTYSGYETGKSEPSINSIAILIRLYSVSADWLWQDETNEQHNSELSACVEPKETNRCYAESQDEIELMKNYRQLNTDGKSTALTTIRAFAQSPDMQDESIKSVTA